MDKKTEALKLALEALKIGYDYAVDETQRFHVEMAGYKPKRHEAMDADVRQIDDAITALRAALEEQPAEQQEPVAWRYNGKLHEFDPSDWATGPVTPLYTSPPAKPWVGLTDEEIAVIAAACGGLASDFVVDVARAIEQAHGITGETK